MRASGYDRAVADWYVEPASVVDALLAVEPFEGVTLDPACGSGNIPRQIVASGRQCFGSDIADRGYGLVNTDFFDRQEQYDNIVSNPPYGIIEQFIEHALALTSSKVAILARLAFLEGQKRQAFFLNTPLARVWVSSRRVSMPPGGSNVPAKGGSIAYAWFVWDHAHKGSPALGWLA